MGNAGSERGIPRAVGRLLSRQLRPVTSAPPPDEVQKLEDHMNDLAEELTKRRQAAVRDFLRRFPHRYHPGWDASFTPPCVCENPFTDELHDPLIALVDTFTLMARLDAGQLDWETLPGSQASFVDLDLSLIYTGPGASPRAALVIPGDPGAGDDPLPPGVLGYLVGFTDGERFIGTTHTTRMSLAEAQREVSAHRVSLRYQWFPVELRGVVTPGEARNG